MLPMCHSSDKGKSYGAFIASMDLKERVSYYSAVAPHIRGEECSSNIGIHLRKALMTYKQTHVLMYRDGVGDRDIKYFHQHEVICLEKCLKELYAQANIQEEPKIVFHNCHKTHQY